MIGDEWKKLNDDAKSVSEVLWAIINRSFQIQEWIDKAKTLRLDYEIELHNYQRQLAEQNGGVVPQQIKASKKKATPSQPSVGEKRQHSQSAAPTK
jgi:hypothetical protein